MKRLPVYFFKKFNEMIRYSKQKKKSDLILKLKIGNLDIFLELKKC